MRKHYAWVGLAAASLVAVGVLGLGAMPKDESPKAPGAASSPSASSALTASSKPSPPAPPPSAIRVDRTIARLEAAHRASPFDVAILLKLGEACYFSHRYSQADAAYRDALALHPGDPTATVRLAMVWHARGDSGRGAKAIEDVLVEEPNHQEAHYSLAMIRFSQQQLDDARAEWAAAARIDPTSVLGHRSQSFVNLLNDSQPQPDEGSSD